MPTRTTRGSGRVEDFCVPSEHHFFVCAFLAEKLTSDFVTICREQGEEGNIVLQPVSSR